MMIYSVNVFLFLCETAYTFRVNCHIYADKKKQKTFISFGKE